MWRRVQHAAICSSFYVNESWCFCSGYSNRWLFLQYWHFSNLCRVEGMVMELCEEVGRWVQSEKVSTFVSVKPLDVSTKDSSILTFASLTSGQKPSLWWIKQDIYDGKSSPCCSNQACCGLQWLYNMQTSRNIIWLLKKHQYLQIWHW